MVNSAQNPERLVSIVCRTVEIGGKPYDFWYLTLDGKVYPFTVEGFAAFLADMYDLELDMTMEVSRRIMEDGSRHILRRFHSRSREQDMLRYRQFLKDAYYSFQNIKVLEDCLRLEVKPFKYERFEEGGRS